MSQAFRIETLDRSGRWYLSPGARSIYDLRIRNDSKNAVECSLVVDEPATGVSIEPATFALRGHEVRTVTVSFAADAATARAREARITLRSEHDGSVLASFEHPLIVAGGTDCSIAMTWKDVIVEGGEVRGFAVACSVRSQSEATSTFQLSLSEHPALSVPALPPISLEPGQLGEMVIPIQWNRSVKDESGWNHPLIIEAAVPVSNGRRTSRMRWESIEVALEPFLKNGAQKMSVTVSKGPASEAAPSPNKAAAPTLSQETAATQAAQPPAAPAQPERRPAPVQEAPPPTAQQKSDAPPAPANAKDVAAGAPAQTIATPASAGATQVQQTPSVPVQEKFVAACSASPAMLMLNGHTQLLMLAAPPSETKPASSSVVQAATAAPPPPSVSPVSTAVSPAEAIELPLFSGLGVQSPAATTNGKAEAPPAVAQPEASATVARSPAQAQTAPAQPAPTPAQPVARVDTPASPQASDSKAQHTPTPPTIAAPTQPAQASAMPAPAAQASAVTWTVKSGLSDESAPKKPEAKPAARTENAAHSVAEAATPGSQHTPTAPAAPVPASKLTPYAPARWSADAEQPVPVAQPAQPAQPAPSQVVVPAQPRTRPVQAAVVRKSGLKLPAGLVIGGLAGGALLVAGLLIFKPTVPAPPSSKPVTVQPAMAPPVVHVAQRSQPVAVHHKVHTPKPVIAAVPSPKPSATPAPTPTARAAATPQPAPTHAPATPRPAARVVASRPAPRPVSHYARLYQPETGPVVALGSVEAYYGPRGRAVRVLWGAAEQAGASIQLIDEHGTTVSATSVRGARSSALLYLPRGFRGPLTVQVSSIGRLGERVATTTSLPAFGQ